MFLCGMGEKRIIDTFLDKTDTDVTACRVAWICFVLHIVPPVGELGILPCGLFQLEIFFEELFLGDCG